MKFTQNQVVKNNAYSVELPIEYYKIETGSLCETSVQNVLKCSTSKGLVLHFKTITYGDK